MVYSQAGFSSCRSFFNGKWFDNEGAEKSATLVDPFPSAEKCSMRVLPIIHLGYQFTILFWSESSFFLL
jgi:hypothetical protein